MDTYVTLAKQAIEEYIKSGEIISAPSGLPKDFYSRRAGIFVTIHKGKELRGCMGTFLPTQKNLAEEIISNAIAACSQDYRFMPITIEELPELNYEVSILSKPSFIKDLGKHNPQKHGIIVKCADGRCGLLLPNLEGIDTTEKQIEIACRKGGINPQMDKIELWEFEVEKHL